MVAGENCKIVNCAIKNAAECGINVSGKIILLKIARLLYRQDAVMLSEAVKSFIYGNNTVTNNSLHDYGEIQKTYIAGVNIMVSVTLFPTMKFITLHIWAFTIWEMKM